MGFETGNSHAAEVSISFLWADSNNEIKTMDDRSVIMELVFKTIHPSNHETIELNSSITVVAAYDKDYNELNLILKAAPVTILESNTENWSVYPNPIRDKVIHIQMNLKDKKILVFRLLDNTGNVLLVQKVEGVNGYNNITLRKENLPTGVYYLKVEGLNGVKELIIEK